MNKSEYIQQEIARIQKRLDSKRQIPVGQRVSLAADIRRLRALLEGNNS